MRGLRKSYGDHIALDGVDFDVPAGSVFTLLGPNGSGKSTTVNVLSTLIRRRCWPRRGGRPRRVPLTDIGEVRAAIGVSGQLMALDPLIDGS